MNSVSPPSSVTVSYTHLTAHGYLDGRSETALKACLTSRYPREDYVLTNKLTANFFKTEADKMCIRDRL